MMTSRSSIGTFFRPQPARPYPLERGWKPPSSADWPLARFRPYGFIVSGMWPASCDLAALGCPPSFHRVARSRGPGSSAELGTQPVVRDAVCALALAQLLERI
jgi:hypothetical protein